MKCVMYKMNALFTVLLSVGSSSMNCPPVYPPGGGLVCVISDEVICIEGWLSAQESVFFLGVMH